MPSILSLNNTFGNQAIGNEENFELADAQRKMYNDQVRKANQEALAQSVMSLASGAGKSAVSAYEAKRNMGQQNAAAQAGLQGDMQDAAANDPRDASALKNSQNAGTQPPTNSPGLSGTQWTKLFGMFMRGMGGNSGFGAMGGASAGDAGGASGFTDSFGGEGIGGVASGAD